MDSWGILKFWAYRDVVGDIELSHRILLPLSVLGNLLLTPRVVALVAAPVVPASGDMSTDP